MTELTPEERPPTASAADAIDWSREPHEIESAKHPSVAEPKYSVESHRESTRSQLALWLMALLTLTVVGILVLMGLEMGGTLDAGELGLGDLGQTVLTPIVTLTGTALGFYFGAQSLSGAETGTFPSPRKPGVLRRLFRWIW